MRTDDRIKTIGEYHRLRGFPEPQHPLISVVDLQNVPAGQTIQSTVINFYSICIKRSLNISLRYGQQEYDFDKGTMFFMAPGQVFSLSAKDSPEVAGWLLLVHPDFLWNTSLAQGIKRFDFFGYSVSEALFLSGKEEAILNGIIGNILQECQTNLDNFSKQIIISHLETLLNYSERFYNRQFLIREKANHQILERLEKLLNGYFDQDDLITKGLPTVQFVADELRVSKSYLSNMLRIFTGQNTQQHIHDKIIAAGKEKLSTTNLSVSEIAYGLGFSHSQSFSKLFKIKTSLTPQSFRRSFK
ncbi:helix-turn-helix domain-containing protein [Pedobacter xixiisoli]|uniref:Transcriptional regulator, AraC family n=1 Tax=Pedobacter xixiisoli TaxID=1476464 RepID=A0A285ZS38_9SPHI|nr:helix-turn-helix domain-containing protein [Pedobacter xixiisoli]SOD12455.1 transcriptional regulator, AraC family [Pedobacter xixiisoli]